MKPWLQAVIAICLVTVSGAGAYRLVVDPTTPTVPTDGNPDLAPVLFAKLNPLLDGDNALYYAGVFQAAAHVLNDEAVGIDTAKQLHAFVDRLSAPVNASEPSPVELKTVLVPLFSGFATAGDLDDKQRAELVALFEALAKAAEASK